MQVIEISPKSIIFPPEEMGLRPEPRAEDNDWDEFLGFKDSIATQGLLNIFSVSEQPDGTYMVIDGSRRAKAVKMLCDEGHEQFQKISVQVTEASEWEALERQITGNVQSKKTKPAQYAAALRKIAIAGKLTPDQLAAKIGKSPQYTVQLLQLNNLPDAAKAALDERKLSITNAIQLQKVPADDFDEFLLLAMSTDGPEFSAKVAEHMSEVAKLRAAEKKGETPEFKPKAKMQPKDTLWLNYTRAEQAVEDEPNDFNQGYALAYAEVFGLDEKSVAAQREAWEAKQHEAEEKKKAREEKRKADKLKESAKFLKENNITSLDELELDS